jgi:hypothetical protein
MMDDGDGDGNDDEMIGQECERGMIWGMDQWKRKGYRKDTEE